MNKNYLILLLFPMLLISCSSGEKALQRGDYFSAITKAVERLKSDPDNSKSTNVLQEGYPMAINWSQEEIDLALTSNQPFKWERTIDMMLRVNHLSKLIRSTPAARKIITEPKSYSSELNLAYEKAAEERYRAGLSLMQENTKEAARAAYDHFYKTNQFISGYQDVIRQMEMAKEIATFNVIVEAATVQTRTYELSSQFFYDQVFEYLNNKYTPSSFVQFYSPTQAEKYQITHPDFIVRMEFYDFSVGNLYQDAREENLSRKVQVPINDSTFVTRTYRAKLKIYTDQVVSGGRLNYQIIDFRTDNLLRDNLIPGSYTWVNQYAIYAGDKQALNERQYELTQRRAIPLPPRQELFIEFTRPIYEQLTNELYQFFRPYR